MYDDPLDTILKIMPWNIPYTGRYIVSCDIFCFSYVPQVMVFIYTLLLQTCKTLDSFTSITRLNNYKTLIHVLESSGKPASAVYLATMTWADRWIKTHRLPTEVVGTCCFGTKYVIGLGLYTLLLAYPFTVCTTCDLSAHRKW